MAETDSSQPDSPGGPSAPEAGDPRDGTPTGPSSVGPRRMRPEIWFDRVTTLCVTCARRIDGKHHITSDGHVVMRQFCPEHGHRAVLVSTRVDWFGRYAHLPAALPARPTTAASEKSCCRPFVSPVTLGVDETSRRLLWLGGLGSGAVTFQVSGTGISLEELSRLLDQARQVGLADVAVEATAGELIQGGMAALLTRFEGMARVAADDPRLGDLLAHPSCPPVSLVSTLTAGVTSESLLGAWRIVVEQPRVFAWEVVPGAPPACASVVSRGHPAHGPKGIPSNGPVPPPGPVAATVSEALGPVLQTIGAGFTVASFFPLVRFHPPGSALALLTVGADGTIASLGERLDPRSNVDLHGGASTLSDEARGAVRALYGLSGLARPSRLRKLVEVAGGDDGFAISSLKCLVVHEPMGRGNFDLNRLRRACSCTGEVGPGCAYAR